MYIWSPKLTHSLPKGRGSIDNSTHEVCVLQCSKWILLMKVRKDSFNEGKVYEFKVNSQKETCLEEKKSTVLNNLL